MVKHVLRCFETKVSITFVRLSKRNYGSPFTFFFSFSFIHFFIHASIDVN